MPRKKSALTLIELLVAILLMGVIVMGLYSIDIFSRNQVISSNKRVKVQDGISTALEFMSKYVQQSTGNSSNPPIVATASGFKVRVDLNSTRTPANLADDSWWDFSLDSSTHKITATCTNYGGGLGCPASPNDIVVITDKLAGELVTNVMPEVPSGITGFFVNITDNGTAVDIGLVGRFDPTYGVWAGPDNPQVCMKTRLISPSSSSN